MKHGMVKPKMRYVSFKESSINERRILLHRNELINLPAKYETLKDVNVMDKHYMNADLNRNLRDDLLEVVYEGVRLFRIVEQGSSAYSNDIFVLFSPTVKPLVHKWLRQEYRTTFRVHNNVNHDTSLPPEIMEESEYLKQLRAAAVPDFTAEELKVNNFDKKMDNA